MRCWKGYGKYGEMQGVDVLTQIETLFREGGLEDIVEHISVERDAHLVKGGTKSNHIYLLSSGQLKVVLPRDNGSAAVVAQIRPGSVIGEMAYYSGQLRSADIMADGVCRLLRIDMDRLDRLEKRDPKVVGAFHKIIASNMARRLNRTTKLLRDMDV